MTDEEKAEEYVRTLRVAGINSYNHYNVEKAYLDGLADGRKDRNCVNCSNHGKQLEVMKLKAQLTELEKRINTLKIKNANLQKKNEKQAKQIEEMKCCGNCRHRLEGEKYKCSAEFWWQKCDKWELAE